jgi:protein deglycase
MAKALVLLADGFEEIEAVTIIDVLRRAEVEVHVAALGGESATGSHGIVVLADGPLARVDASQFDAVVLPGGMPGAKHLSEDARVQQILREAAASGKLVAAICAAPTALEAAGVLSGKRATSYPGFKLPSAQYSEDRVVEDGNVITSRGVGTALEFALKLVERLVSPAAARQHGERMLAG